jgi:hypothetical protein
MFFPLVLCWAMQLFAADPLARTCNLASLQMALRA